MRITIDWELCIGSGQCVATAPSAFRLVPYGRGFRAVLAGPGVDEALLAAADACPTLAIQLSGEHGEPVFPVGAFDPRPAQ